MYGAAFRYPSARFESPLSSVPRSSIAGTGQDASAADTLGTGNRRVLPGFPRGEGHARIAGAPMGVNGRAPPRDRPRLSRPRRARRAGDRRPRRRCKGAARHGCGRRGARPRPSPRGAARTLPRSPPSGRTGRGVAPRRRLERARRLEPRRQAGEEAVAERAGVGLDRRRRRLEEEPERLGERDEVEERRLVGVVALRAGLELDLRSGGGRSPPLPFTDHQFTSPTASRSSTCGEKRPSPQP